MEHKEVVHRDKDSDNNVELWHKYQTARENLRTKTDFFNKYKAPITHRTNPPDDPAVNRSPAKADHTTSNAESTAHSAPRVKHKSKQSEPHSVATGSSSHNLYDASPLLKQAEWDSGSLKTAPSHRDNPGQGTLAESCARSVSPQVADINTSPVSKNHVPDGGDSFHGSEVVTPHPKIASESQPEDAQLRTENQATKFLQSSARTSGLGSSGPAAACEIESSKRTGLSKTKGTPASSNSHSVTTRTDKIRVIVKMSDSDQSEEVLLHRYRGQGQVKASTGQVQESQTKSSTPQDKLTDRPEPGPAPRGDTPIHFSVENSSYSEQKPRPEKRKGVRQTEATAEAKEELRRLQQEIRAQVGKCKLKTDDRLDSNPEALMKARTGPGTDPTSVIYRRIIKRLDVGRADSIFTFPLDITEKEKQELQWTLYAQDVRAYPEIEEGHVVLSPHPRPKELNTPDGSPFGEIPPCPTPQEIVDSVNWDAINNWEFGDLARRADWEYSPAVWNAPVQYRNWFYAWLDSTMHICYYADIYHMSFFDGTAHSDGLKGMFIPNIEHPEAKRNLEDEKTNRHCHETVDGYRFNYITQQKKEQVDSEIRRREARAQYLAAMRTPPSSNPNVPKANIYLRPAEVGDIPELLSLYNWYVANATQCVDATALAEQDMRQRIDDCKREKLPFIVAVERKSAILNGRIRRDQNENVMGYALATDFMGARTIGRHTAEIEIFVHHTKRDQGVGRCLMDKLLEICDPTYLGRGGYFFDSDLEDGGCYSPGSSRRLARLVIAISYSEDDPSDYHRVKEWLMRRHRFEEQGLLKGAARKFDKL